ncbi:DUF3558 domain-containing protein [Nocardia cyriacigeorgica]|uniref:DUF3558 domain-containing protein n=1 Tax=Nocardia cyriacigeorgica TaxID=135487 RepID=UPI001893BE8A|nr:DUF3558 domain-containing protein [Nocardia cyriacigeorgica]MBF6161349.1 DUF3558 domain-containing protein [Nocardia cyriacigeorgica]MBF6200226.1 DUF3558 domain-containing protein [Nocardia cyriacigeorgica]
MRTADVLRVTLAAGAAVLLAAGCNTTVDGEATTQGDGAASAGSPTAVAIFNPCSDLSEQALTDAGLDPSTERTSIDPPSGGADWRICSWKPSDSSATYRVDVFSTSYTIDEARQNDNLTGFKDVTIGPRSGVTLYDKSDTKRDRCYAAFPAEQGMFEVAVTWRGSSSDMPDMCVIAVDQATKLEPNLPK